MLRIVLFVLGISFFSQKSLSLNCEYNIQPDPKDEIPIYEIDLDSPPETRWYIPVHDKKEELKTLVKGVRTLLQELLGDTIFQYLYERVPMIAPTLPYPYGEEIRSISQFSEIPMADITMYNIFYEIFIFCTSVLAQNDEGDILHGRNLDNGVFLGWNASSHMWTVTEHLKPLTVQLKWFRSGHLVFESVTFVGYVGVLTAVKKGVFSFSLNKRMSWNNGIFGLIEWLVFHDPHLHWVTMLSREVLENARTFEEAEQILTRARLTAPVYYILAGTKPYEGVVITRFRSDHDVIRLNNSTWFLVQTNYDHWNSQPFFDDRKTPAEKCLRRLRKSGLTSSALFGVLHTKPVRNKSTVYTAIMNPKNGTVKSWKSHCPDPCFPWL